MVFFSYKWILYTLFLSTLIFPVSALHSFVGGDYSIHGCNHDQEYCTVIFDTIKLRTNLSAISIQYQIRENNQSHLEEDFTINFTFWKANYTRFGNQIVYHSPGLIGSYEGTGREGYRIFDSEYEPNRSDYDFILKMNYSNPNYGDVTNKGNREYARFRFDLYRITEGEDPSQPTPSPTPASMPVEQLNQNGQDLSLTIIRGQPFTFSGIVSQPRITGKENITQARFWIFGDHYAIVRTVPVNRVNGSFTVSLDGNETAGLNNCTYRFFAEYPAEWDFFSISITQGFINKGLCVCNNLFSLDRARTMSSFEAAERFEIWVNEIPLQTPMYKTTILVVDPAASSITDIPDPRWDSNLQSTQTQKSEAPENVTAASITDDYPVTTPQSSPMFVLIPVALILGTIFRHFRMY